MTTVTLGLIGDSHFAALRGGWKTISADMPDVTFEMFGAPADSFRTVGMGDGVLVASKQLRRSWRMSGGADRMHAARYDAIVMCGFGTNANRHVAVLKEHSLRGRRTSVQLMSAKALLATLVDRLEGSSGGRLARWLSRHSHRPIFWVQTPRTTRRWVSEHAPDWLPRTVTDKEFEDLFRATDEAMGALAARHGIVVLRQPPETLDGPCFSSMIYARDNDADPRLAKTGIDTVHMNATYGRLVWKTHLPTVLAAARLRPEPSGDARRDLVAG